MIEISEDLFDKVEYLIQQSVQGNHILFDPQLIRKVFRSRPLKKELAEEIAYAVEPHIEKLISLPTLVQKKAYLEKLDTQTLHNVIRTYFNIIENNIFENTEVRH